MTRQQEALSQIKQTPAYKELKKFLEDRLASNQQALEICNTEVQFRQIQGQCQAYRSVLDMFENELVLIEKLTKKPESTIVKDGF